MEVVFYICVYNFTFPDSKWEWIILSAIEGRCMATYDTKKCGANMPSVSI